MKSESGSVFRVRRGQNDSCSSEKSSCKGVCRKLCTQKYGACALATVSVFVECVSNRILSWSAWLICQPSLDAGDAIDGHKAEYTLVSVSRNRGKNYISPLQRSTNDKGDDGILCVKDRGGPTQEALSGVGLLTAMISKFCVALHLEGPRKCSVSVMVYRERTYWAAGKEIKRQLPVCHRLKTRLSWRQEELGLCPMFLRPP